VASLDGVADRRQLQRHARSEPVVRRVEAGVVEPGATAVRAVDADAHARDAAADPELEHPQRHGLGGREPGQHRAQVGVHLHVALALDRRSQRVQLDERGQRIGLPR
jgi:hypothetical protein